MTPGQRALLFWLLCLPARAGLAYLVVNAGRSPAYPLLGWFYVVAGIGEAYLAATGARMQAPEGGGTTWWASWRPMFASIWLTTGTAALLRASTNVLNVAWADPVAGALLWLSTAD